MSQLSDTRKILRSLREQGATIERTDNHWHVMKDGRLVVKLPTHPCDDGSRGRKSQVRRAALRRAGFEL